MFKALLVIRGGSGFTGRLGSFDPGAQAYHQGARCWQSALSYSNGALAANTGEVRKRRIGGAAG
jgi:hypothetical protein